MVLRLQGGVIDGVDKAGDVLLVGVGGLQGVHQLLVLLVGLGDGAQGHHLVVVVQVLIDEHGVVLLLPGLDLA